MTCAHRPWALFSVGSAWTRPHGSPGAPTDPRMVAYPQPGASAGSRSRSGDGAGAQELVCRQPGPVAPEPTGSHSAPCRVCRDDALESWGGPGAPLLHYPGPPTPRPAHTGRCWLKGVEVVIGGPGHQDHLAGTRSFSIVLHGCRAPPEPHLCLYCTPRPRFPFFHFSEKCLALPLSTQIWSQGKLCLLLQAAPLTACDWCSASPLMFAWSDSPRGPRGPESVRPPGNACVSSVSGAQRPHCPPAPPDYCRGHWQTQGSLDN